MHHSQEVNSPRNSRFFGLLFASIFVAALCVGYSSIAGAQLGIRGLNDGSIQVNIYDESGTLIDVPARVTLSGDGSLAATQEMIADDGTLRFYHLPSGHYVISVICPGYKDGSTEVDIDASSSVMAPVTMQPTADNAESTTGTFLAPKAKKNVDDGIAALRAAKYDMAREDLEAAYQLAPGDPNVNDALGLMYLAQNNLPQAQDYIQRALSIDPKNMNALLDYGQLRMMQRDFSGAEEPLQRAVTLAPRDKLAHWLLGMTYLNMKKFDLARAQAEAAIKVSKGVVTEADYLLGQALAGLGRNAEAVKTLQTFVHQLPHDYYAQAAQTMIAQLQAPQSSGDGLASAAMVH